MNVEKNSQLHGSSQQLAFEGAEGFGRSGKGGNTIPIDNSNLIVPASEYVQGSLNSVSRLDEKKIKTVQHLA